MHDLPPSLKARGPLWQLAIFLKVVEEFSLVVATFTPVKAILILGTGTVPGVFPVALVDGGPMLASLVLIGIAIVSSGLSAVLNRAVRKLDGHSFSDKELKGLRKNHYFFWKSVAERKMVSAAVAILLSLMLLAAISLPFTLLLLSWVVAVSGTLSIFLTGKILKPYESRREQLISEIGRALSLTSLWSMVGVALITLYTSLPNLGVTGILLAVVVGRRILVRVPLVLPLVGHPSVLKGASRENRKRSDALFGRGTLNKTPHKFVLSTFGNQVVSDYFQRLGALPGFRLVNSGVKGPLSLCANRPSGSQILLRLFSSSETYVRDSEIVQRQQLSDGKVFLPTDNQSISLAGLPGIQIELLSDFECLAFGQPVSREEVAIFQLDIENQGSSWGEFQSGPPSIDLGEILQQLEMVRGMEGSNAEAVDALISVLPGAFVYVDQIPNTLVPMRALEAADFYRSRDGSVAFLGGVMWRQGLAGDSWGEVGLYSTLLENRWIPGLSSGGVPAARTLNAEIHHLSAALSGFEWSSLDERLRRITSQLDLLR